MKPRPEAVEWGKEQASKSPRWGEAKWQRISTIFEVVFTSENQADEHEADEQTRDAA